MKTFIMYTTCRSENFVKYLWSCSVCDMVVLCVAYICHDYVMELSPWSV